MIVFFYFALNIILRFETKRMESNFCYCCESQLSKVNFSTEHILPNSIGGKIKSNYLLCITCNNLLGNEIDDELARQLNFLMNLFMLKRERGKFQPMSGKTKNGEEYVINGIEVKSKPKISVNDNTVNFVGNNEEDMKIYFKGLLKKYPYLKIEDIINNSNKKKYFLNEPIGLNLNIGGEKTFRAIAKIAVNFYIHKGGDRGYINNILDYIKGKENKTKKVWFHYSFSDNTLKVDENKLYHLIKIIGNSTEKILYCYIELFGTLKLIIYLNDNYNGENLDYQYFYNLFSKQIIHDYITINYNRNEIFNIFNNSKNQDFTSELQNALTKTINIAHKIQSSKVISELINNSIEKVLEKNKDGKTKISEELLKEFANDLSVSMAIYLSRSKDQNKTYF